MKTILENASEILKSSLLDHRGNDCRTFVIAKRSLAAEHVMLFRSYRCPGDEEPCSIVQAARATSAASTFFRPLSIGLDSFVDGGLGYNR